MNTYLEICIYMYIYTYMSAPGHRSEFREEGLVGGDGPVWASRRRPVCRVQGSGFNLLVGGNPVCFELSCQYICRKYYESDVNTYFT